MLCFKPLRVSLGEIHGVEFAVGGAAVGAEVELAIHGLEAVGDGAVRAGFNVGGEDGTGLGAIAAPEFAAVVGMGGDEVDVVADSEHAGRP